MSKMAPQSHQHHRQRIDVIVKDEKNKNQTP